MMIDRSRLDQLLQRERELYASRHAGSKAAFEKNKSCLLDGVPMNWMVKWPGGFPLVVKEAAGARFSDLDGNEFSDFCLGYSGSLAGHSPQPVLEAVAERMKKGIHFMLPSQDAGWVGEELSRRFGLPLWQVVLSASDANRFAIRLARLITGRRYVLVFNWCYHGTVDESFITLEQGIPGPRRGNLGPPVNPVETSKVIEFNDLAALEKTLAPEDVACVLAEPAMTNIGIVQPDPGYWEAVQEIARRTGTLLILDETHTMSAGPGGCTALYGLKPDLLTVGKSIAGGIPAAVYGCSAAVAQKIQANINIDDCDTGGIGGTLAGNALSLAAMRATLQQVLTPEAFQRAIGLTNRFCQGIEQTIKEFSLPWHVVQLGCRAEYWFRSGPVKNGGDAVSFFDAELYQYMFLFTVNRGILMSPYYNIMALLCSQTSEAEVDRHSEIFRAAVKELLDR